MNVWFAAPYLGTPAEWEAFDHVTEALVWQRDHPTGVLWRVDVETGAGGVSA